MINTLHIVACSKAKIWDKERSSPKLVKCENAYRGNMFKQAQNFITKYQETFKEDPLWRILSAKYGILTPGVDKIENYNVSFSDPKFKKMTQEESENLYFPMAEKIKNIIDEFGVDRIVIWGGTEYGKVIDIIIKKYLRMIYLPIHHPSYGLRMGYAIQQLKNLVDDEILLELENRKK